MNQELLTVLEHLEREKGVSRTVLIEAIEAALVSAGRKVLHDPEAEVTAKVDPETGDMEVFTEGKKIDSGEFGRIAAQTAKQVIIQKIRDAERDVIYAEFEPKVNQIVSGTVFRYDRGTVIIDLGKTDAILPKREQSGRDVYRQGDRMRVFILEVSKGPKGPQIIVSRNHTGLVKKLFEIEVPEVLDNIVEIKGISREAGDRSKIAVWSKDEKVDCVGACVGMRGSRVKTIVRELQGEKLDIVRWSDSPTEYVRAALSPAECVSIEIESTEEKRIRVIIEDDQLSLAIGKNGQNVRLASKLTGWNIDIRSKTELAKKALEAVAPTVPEGAAMQLSEIKGVSPKIAEALKTAGIEDVASLQKLSKKEFIKIKGIGDKTADKIMTAVADLPKPPEKKEGEAGGEEKGPEELKKEEEDKLVESVKSKLLAPETKEEVKPEVEEKAPEAEEKSEVEEESPEPAEKPEEAEEKAEVEEKAPEEEAKPAEAEAQPEEEKKPEESEGKSSEDPDIKKDDKTPDKDTE